MKRACSLETCRDSSVRRAACSSSCACARITGEAPGGYGSPTAPHTSASACSRNTARAAPASTPHNTAFESVTMAFPL